MLNEVVSELSNYYIVKPLKQFYDTDHVINLVVVKTSSLDNFRLTGLLNYIFRTKPIFDKYGTIQCHYKGYIVNLYFANTYNSELAVYYHNYDNWGYLLNLLAEDCQYYLTAIGLYTLGEYASNDPKQISTLLDINYDVYCLGFYNDVELFQTITNSSLFNPRRFIVKDLNRTPQILFKFVQYINETLC